MSFINTYYKDNLIYIIILEALVQLYISYRQS